MNSDSRRRSRISLVAMIVGGLLRVAPVFGPLGETLHYLADFIADATTADASAGYLFFAELPALIVCPFVLLHVCHIAGFFYPKWQANHAA